MTQRGIQPLPRQTSDNEIQTARKSPYLVTAQALPTPGLPASLPLASDTALPQPHFSGQQASPRSGQKDVCTRQFPACPGDVGFTVCRSQLGKGITPPRVHSHGTTVTSSGGRPVPEPRGQNACICSPRATLSFQEPSIRDDNFFWGPLSRKPTHNILKNKPTTSEPGTNRI